MTLRPLGVGVAATMLMGALAAGASAAPAGSIWQVVVTANPQAHQVTNSFFKNFNVPYVLHWNGTKWSLTKTPNGGGEGRLLEAIRALSAADVWAVGQTRELDGTIRTLTERFNGSKWAVVASPNPGKTGNDSLDAIASPGGRLLFAVGADEISGQCCLRTLGLLTRSG